MITLEAVEYWNFHSVVHTRIPLADQGLVIVTGPNGSGKSTLLLDGIAYALYGVSLRYKAQTAMYGETPGAKVMRRGCKDLLVKLWLQVDDYRLLVVRARGRKDYVDGLSLYTIDAAAQEVEVSLGRTKDTQEVLNRMLGLGPKAFCRAIILTREVLDFPRLPDARKKEVMNELLDLSILDEALETSKAALSQARSDLEAVQVTGQTLEEQRGWMAEQIEDLKVRQQGFEQERQATVEGHLEAARELRQVKGQKAELAALSKQSKAAEVRAGQLTTFIETAEQEIEASTTLYAQQQVAHDTQLAILQDRYTVLEEMVLAATNTLGEDLAATACPLCGLGLSGDHLQRKMEEHRQQMEQIQREMRELTQDQALPARMRELTQAREYMRTQRNALRKAQTEQDQAAIQHQRTKEAHARRQQQAEEAEAAAQAAQAEQSPYQSQLKLQESQLQTVTGRLRKAQEAQLELSGAVEREELLVECFGPKGARIIMLNAIIPFLNQEAARVQQVIRTDLSIHFRIRTVEESFAGTLSVEVNNPQGAESYEGDSAGEKARIDLMILFSLLALVGSRGNKSVAQSFFDEAFESLDQVGQTAVHDLLRDAARKKSSVFFLSHANRDLEVDQEWKVERGGLVTGCPVAA